MKDSMKRCSGCLLSLPLTEFQKRSRSADGLHTRCKPCVAEMHARYEGQSGHARGNQRHKGNQIERARRHVFDYLLEHPCVDCGEGDILTLEFDHVRGVKLFDIGNVMNHGASIATLDAEIEKCDVRCANCHRRVTHLRANTWRVKLLQSTTR